MPKLHDACKKGDFEEIKRLLDGSREEALGVKDENDRTLIEIAIKFGNIDIIHFLLKRYMSVQDYSLIHSENVDTTADLLFSLEKNSSEIDKSLLANCFRILGHMAEKASYCLYAFNLIRPIATTDTLRYKAIKIVESFDFFAHASERSHILLAKAMVLLDGVQLKDDRYFKTKAKLFGMLATCCAKESKWDSAIKRAKEALAIYEGMNDLESVSDILRNLDGYYARAGDVNAHLTHLFGVVSKYKDNKENDKIIFSLLFYTLLDIGDVYAKQDRKSDAKHYYLKAFDYVNESNFGVLCIAIDVLLKNLQALYDKNDFGFKFYQMILTYLHERYKPGASKTFINFLNETIADDFSNVQYQPFYEPLQKIIGVLLRIHNRYKLHESENESKEIALSLEKLLKPQEFQNSSPLRSQSIFPGISADSDDVMDISVSKDDDEQEKEPPRERYHLFNFK